MEPVSISSEAMQAAIRLMTDYFLPMAARVLGAASVPQDERDARVLARWIAETGPARINVSAIRDDARLSGLRDTLRVKGACRFLEEAGIYSLFLTLASCSITRSRFSLLGAPENPENPENPPC